MGKLLEVPSFRGLLPFVCAAYLEPSSGPTQRGSDMKFALRGICVVPFRSSLPCTLRVHTRGVSVTTLLKHRPPTGRLRS